MCLVRVLWQCLVSGRLRLLGAALHVVRCESTARVATSAAWLSVVTGAWVPQSSGTLLHPPGPCGALRAQDAYNRAPASCGAALR
jgi:hypothetical protein